MFDNYNLFIIKFTRRHMFSFLFEKLCTNVGAKL